MPSVDEFPGNIVRVLVDHVKVSAWATTVLERPLRPTDPNGSIGISARDWAPLEYAIGQWDPALARYMIQAEGMTRNTSQEEAQALQNQIAKNLRLMLYRDTSLRAALVGLSESASGVLERVTKFGVESQRFATNDVGNEFMFYSVANIQVETETV